MKKMKIVLSFFFFLIFFGLILHGKISGEEFDSEKWKYSNLSSEKNWSLRWDMMNSLRNNYELKGKTEIINLLGRPQSQDSKNSFSYYLGYTKNGINTGRLTFHIGFDGKICDFDVWEG